MNTTDSAADFVVCATCGKPHPRAETEVVFKRPDPFLAIPDAEREERTKVDDDLCMIDEKRFFVRSVLPVPVNDGDNDYCWGVWAEVTEASFARILALWSEPDQVNEPTIDATLANEMPYYGDTYGLRVALQLSGPATRPTLRLVDVHPVLSKHQKDGVSRGELLSFSHARASA